MLNFTGKLKLHLEHAPFFVVAKSTKNVHQRHKTEDQHQYFAPDSRSKRNIDTHHRGLGDTHLTKRTSKLKTIETILKSTVLT